MRLPLHLVARIEAKGPSASYIIAALKEKLQREDEAEMDEGFAPLAASPEMWDMRLPTDGQVTVHAKVWRNGKPEAKPFPTVTASRADAPGKLADALRQWLAGG